jgi:mono/diheme cytochrome c family protein
VVPGFLALAALPGLALWGCGSKTGGSEGASSSAPAPGSTTSSTPPAETTAATSPAPPAGAVSLELGEKVFKQRCVLCHGPDGHGNGTAAAALKPHPRNFHDAAYMKSRTDDQLLLTIHNGKGPMPAWKTILSEAEMRSALLYVRQFANAP